MKLMQLSFDYDNTYPGPAFPIAEFTVISRATGHECQITGLIDSGADGTIIPWKILHQIGARAVDEAWARNISGQRYAVRLYAVNLRIGTHTLFGIEVIANEQTDETIIGRDVLNQLIVTLNGLAQVTEITNRAAYRYPIHPRTTIVNSPKWALPITASWRGRGRSIATSATMRPGRSLMTKTRSAKKTASGMLWVTINTVI